MRTSLSLLKSLALSFFVVAGAAAHPMGNFSVNHYARLEPGSGGVAVTWVLDLAELPAFELMQAWSVTQDSPRGELERRAAAQARGWVGDLSFTEDGRKLTPRVEATELAITDGAGNLPTFRITTKLFVAAKGGRLEYVDNNYSTRAGWREIVVRAAAGAGVERASNDATDLSHALTAYPQDPANAPPQDTQAWVEWKPLPVTISRMPEPVVKPAVATDVRPPEPRVLGTVKRNDAISRILREKNISWPLMAALIGLAFWFGALHALEPGHGKTMVAAYLVGERGTPKHAMLLGGMVTFTHTISVFGLGLVTMFLSRYIMPEKISRVLGIVSGLSIVWIGGMLLWRRARALKMKAHAHSHPHTHSHGGYSHSHLPKRDVSMSSLMALGVSGGLVPCPSALILLLGSISIGRTGLGMVLLVAFSLGLALVLMATGLAVLYATKLLPERRRRSGPVLRYLPVASAAVVCSIGILMTGVSLGWVPAMRFLS